MSFARITIDSPTSFADGSEYDVAFEFAVEFDPGVEWDSDEASRSGCVTIKDVQLLSCAATIGCVDLELTHQDRDMLMKSWLAVPKNEARLRRKCADYWNERGREDELRDDRYAQTIRRSGD